jgi:dihydroneopterin aldolase
VSPVRRAIVISLAALEAPCHCGVTAEERRVAQTLLLDLRLMPLDVGDYADDDLADTIDYGGVARLAVATAAERPYKLLERLATEIADRLWTAHELAELCVSVRKQAPPVGAPAATAGAHLTYRR